MFDIRCFPNTKKRYLKLHRTTDPRGNYLGTVHAVPTTGINGVLNANGTIVAPDMVAFRECVPARWRKAYDRAGHGLWWNKNGEQRGSITLYTLRGELMGTIYAEYAPRTKDKPQ